MYIFYIMVLHVKIAHLILLNRKTVLVYLKIIKNPHLPKLIYSILSNMIVCFFLQILCIILISEISAGRQNSG